MWKQNQAPQSYNSQVARKGRKLILLSASGLVILFVIAAVLYVVFAYLPKTPENRYRRGLASVGAGLQTLSEGEFLDVISSTSYKGRLAAELRGSDLLSSQVFSYDITVDQSGQYGDAGIIDNLDLNINYDSGQGDSGRISGKLETRFLVGEAGSAPKLFLKFSEIVLPDEFEDLLRLLSSGGESDLDEIDGTWYMLDFQKLVDSGEISSDDLADLNLEDAFHQDDFQEMYLIFVDALKEYFFTSETDKMVLQMDELIGEENFKGTQSLKYSVTVNKSNLRAYLKKLRTDLAEAEFVKKLSSSDPEFDLSVELLGDDVIEAFADDFAELDYEIWVDKDTGVMRNLRITEVDKASGSYGSYFDFGISLRDDNEVIVVDFSGKSFSELNCFPNIFSLYNDFNPDDVSEDCPYLFDEEGNITSLKDDPQAFFDYSWSININVSESKIGHEAAFVVSYNNFTIDISLEIETVGQSGEFAIEAPADYEELDLSELASPAGERHADSILEANRSFHSANDRLPDASELSGILNGQDADYAYTVVNFDDDVDLDTSDELEDVYVYIVPNADASVDKSLLDSEVTSLLVVQGAVCPLFDGFTDQDTGEVNFRHSTSTAAVAVYYYDVLAGLSCVDWYSFSSVPE